MGSDEHRICSTMAETPRSQDHRLTGLWPDFSDHASLFIHHTNPWSDFQAYLAGHAKIQSSDRGSLTRAWRVTTQWSSMSKQGRMREVEWKSVWLTEGGINYEFFCVRNLKSSQLCSSTSAGTWSGSEYSHDLIAAGDHVPSDKFGPHFVWSYASKKFILGLPDICKIKTPPSVPLDRWDELCCKIELDVLLLP